jgi:hypothetical protein
MTLLERVQGAIDAAADHTCVHPIPPPMETIGTSDRIACPSCIVKYHIAMIKTVQLGLEYRGGVFGSKQHVLPDDFGMTHNNWTKLWTATKIESSDDIAILEEMQNQYPEQAEEWGIPQALRDWEQAQDDLARVAGYNYVEEEDVEEIVVESETPPSSPPKDITGQFQSVDLFDPFTDVEIDAAPEPGVDDVSSTSTSNPSVEEDEPKALSTSTSSIKRSALKGSRSTALPSTRATFSEQTTIIPEDTHASNPDIKREHSEYTVAEKARRNTSFYRPSSAYQAAAWASPDGWEKEDTSFSAKSWDLYDILARMNRSTENMTASKAQPVESTSAPAMVAALADAMADSPKVKQGVVDAVPKPRNGEQKAPDDRRNKEPEDDGMNFVPQSER